MPIPEPFSGKLRLPAIAAPMFLASRPELVLATCTAGVVGTFPALNARPTAMLSEWLVTIKDGLETARAAAGGTPIAPYGVNLIVHKSNPRVEPDLEVLIEHKVPLVITSVGSPGAIAERIHAYGGLVFHDVTNIRHAKKAAEMGVDGLILVCAGAGGHGGTLSPFALLGEVRQFWDKTIILAGCISDGRAIRAAEVMGADLAYIGTRFIATRESGVKDRFREMLVEEDASGITYTPAVSGIPGNFLRQSMIESGLDPDNLPPKDGVDMAKELDEGKNVWVDVWSAGQGVGSIHDIPSCRELIDRMADEYQAACRHPTPFL